MIQLGVALGFLIFIIGVYIYYLVKRIIKTIWFNKVAQSVINIYSTIIKEVLR